MCVGVFGSWLDRRHGNGVYVPDHAHVIGVNMDKVKGENSLPPYKAATFGSVCAM